MWTGSQYKPLNPNQLYIDKSNVLEDALASYPLVYLQGAAASGKTTCVRMLLSKLSEKAEIHYCVVWLDEFADRVEALLEMLAQLERAIENQETWVIFENCPGSFSARISTALCAFLKRMQDSANESRVIFCGRERMPECFLDFLWKRQMELISQKNFLFTKEETRKYVSGMGCASYASAIDEETGGWAGCVDLMARSILSRLRVGESEIQVQEIRESYEIKTYIEKHILETLSVEERELVGYASVCPWLEEALCQDLWNVQQAGEYLKVLEQKGLLVQDKKSRKWRIAPLFQNIDRRNVDDGKLQDDLGVWYDAHGYVREALACLQYAENQKFYQDCVIKNFRKIPFMDVFYERMFEEETIKFREYRPEVCYLRGMYAYLHQDLDGLQKEIGRLEKIEEKSHLEKEVYLNLCYVDVRISTDQWLVLLEKEFAEETFCLYQMTGGSVSFLSGLRDLTEVFACSKKEENRKAKIWGNCLGEHEWRGYQLARMEYYIETGRSAAVLQADLEFLEHLTKEMPGTENEVNWQYHLAALYLSYRLQKFGVLSDLERSLLQNENQLCRRNAEAIFGLYARERQEQLVRWLKKYSVERESEIDEFNFMQSWCVAKGYLFLHQYEKAGKILQRLIPFLQYFHKRRWTAEALFQMALVHWAYGRRNQALRSTIESFLLTGDGRYTEFYTLYGNVGKEVLDVYIDWMHGSRPEGWHRKKKYNYGNVLRMPVEDYVETILRKARKEARNSGGTTGDLEKERLTMTETIVLQCIGRGLTNQQICEELNLKLPTVKTHIYNIYKKLEASSRVQAILIGKEMGILE